MLSFRMSPRDPALIRKNKVCAKLPRGGGRVGDSGTEGGYCGRWGKGGAVGGGGKGVLWEVGEGGAVEGRKIVETGVEGEGQRVGEEEKAEAKDRAVRVDKMISEMQQHTFFSL